jgi:hypothetical protein
MRTTVLRLYVAAVVVAAGVATALLPAEGATVDPVALSLLILLTVLAGARPVRFVGKGNEITATHSTIICALASLGAAAALMVAAAGVAATLVIRRQRPKPIRCVFNFAGVLLSTSVAAHLFFTLGGIPGAMAPTLFWPLFAATASYYVLNTGLVAMAVAVERSLSFHRVWDGLRWTAPSYLTGGILALGLVAAYDYLGPLGFAFGLPPIWVLLNFYSTYHGKLEEKELRISDAETLNARLQGKVDELEQALAEVHELRSLLPICMHCKSIRDDDNTWHQIEAYITRNYDTSFTHSLCDNCREEHYHDVPVPDKAVKRGD